MIIHEEQVGETLIRISYDENFDDNPRDWDVITKMICFHRKYELGDKHNYNSDDYSGWDDFKNQLMRDNDVHTILPIYLYDHSGITIRTTSFNDRWDSGQVGWIYITNKNVEFIDNPKEKLIHDVELYDKYLRGEIYNYELIQKDEVMESCGGFFDRDECIAMAKEQIKYYDEAPEVKQ